MHERVQRSFVLMALLCTASAAVAGQEYRRTVRSCNANELERPQQVRVPIGCDVIGAQIGCPLDAGLTLKLDAQIPAGVTVTAAVTGSPATGHPALRWSGGRAGPRDGARRLSTGETQISGFSTSASTAPMLVLEFDGEPLSSRADYPEAHSAVVQLVQWVGNVRVSQALATVDFRSCPQTVLGAERSDSIALLQNDSGRQAIALLDGRRGGGCVQAERRFGVDAIALGNMLPSTPCSGSGVAIFTQSRAVDYLVNTPARPNAIVWKAEGGEQQERALAAPVVQPVKVWLLATTVTVEDVQSMMDTAQDALARSFSGIRLSFAGPKNLSADTRAAVLAARRVNCTSSTLAQATLAKLKAVRVLPGSGVPGQLEPPMNRRLDVFFVNHAGGANGWWCGWGINGHIPGGENFLLIGPTAGDVVLAHEIGHALMNSGHHANKSVDAAFGADNLMRSSASAAHLTIGQLFRASLQEEGAVNRLQIRSGDDAQCPEFVSSDRCPRAACDVLRTSDPLLLPLGEAMQCAP